MPPLLQLVEKSIEHNFCLYASELVTANKDDFYNECFIAKDRFDKAFPNLSSTWTYRYYNVFSLTAGSNLFYDLMQQIGFIGRKFANTTEPLWFQSWLNFHSQAEVLPWHDHQDCICHGFVSIEPRNTVTEFEHYKIHNECGKIYVGQPEKKHRVQVLSDFDAPRITIAFDILDKNSFNTMRNKHGNDINLSLFPLPN
jgi:hypothetical protein